MRRNFKLFFMIFKKNAFFYVLFNIIFSERKLFNLSSFFENSFGLNYNVCNLFSPLLFSFFSLGHMNSYTACLVGCSRILVGS